MANLTKHGLFATAESLQQVEDFIAATLPPEHRVAAFTATYMAWNLACEVSKELKSKPPGGKSVQTRAEFNAQVLRGE